MSNSASVGNRSAWSFPLIAPGRPHATSIQGVLLALMALAALFALSMSWGFPVAALAALGMGASAGVAQGVIVAAFSSNPIITSIAAASLLDGVATVVSAGRAILAEGNIAWLGHGSIVPGIPRQAVVFLAMVALLEFVVERSRTGRELRSTGINRAAAELAGLRASKQKLPG